ncbi:hypothetical protein CkaCkLH20_04608 [Colletotrichum karsti]|uniref:DUF8035 domain-containing protein n=1 Tax=Colletotrichum karsti TaxID=1095194 RepID=A0A9P6I948_9PEZI|nr:uncharacterized protein CkaCkLH20_04608 [Colletotrichum karsti]KAF9878032.1 hypothetical protein CkaCkLH20_04608 [Colletotrichum karsti]
MSNGTFPNIGAVDAFARALFRRAKTAGPEFVDIATVVRRLHTVLKHLKVEAEDPDSLLNSSGAAVYARQLAPLIEDCDFALKQLDTILEKYGGIDRLEERERDMVDMIRTKLAAQKTNIDMFLDTVQLHNPTKAQRVVDEQGGNLDNIKDKVDAIAARLFARRDSGIGGDDEEDLWQQFRTELEKEGFSKEVLRKNKEVLRAYIRELEESTSNDATAPPSVRGLLAQERRQNGETYGSYDAPRRMADPRTSVPNMPNQFSALSTYDHDTDDEHNDSLALISTRDLMVMDNINTGMDNLRIGGPPLQHYSISPSDASPSTRYLPPDVANNLGVSPRFVPPIVGSAPSPRTSSSRLAPDRYGMNIPLEAQWTRIRRALVSPEILERAGVRYEARPDYVAVLGVLTREEITKYARLSAEARAARSRNRPNANGANSSPPSQRRRGDSRGATSSSDDVLWDSSDASSDSNYDNKPRKREDGKYFIVPPPSDREKGTSPAATVQPKPILKNKNENRVHFDPEPHEVDATPRSYRDDRDRDRGGDRRPRRPSRREHRDHDRDRDRERDYRDRDRGERDYHRDHRSDRDRDHYPRRGHHRDRADRDSRRDKKKAWGETLGAVGIGGAAASLLSVLTEAASVL